MTFNNLLGLARPRRLSKTRARERGSTRLGQSPPILLNRSIFDMFGWCAFNSSNTKAMHPQPRTARVPSAGTQVRFARRLRVASFELY